MAVKGKVVSGVVWSFVQNVAARLIAFSVFIVLGRILAPATFGLVALAQATIDLLLIWVGQGAVPYLVHKEGLDETDRSTAFWTSLCIGGLLALGISAAAPLVGMATDTMEVVPVVRWLSLVIPLHALSKVHIAILTREFRFKELALRTGVAAILGGASGLASAIAGWGAYALVTQVLVGQVVSVASLWWASGWRPTGQWSKPHALTQLRYGAGITGDSLLRMIGTRADRFLIAAALGTSVLGTYAIARRILDLCTNLLSKSGDAVAMSVFARNQGDGAALDTQYKSALTFTVFINAPAFTGLAVLSEEAIGLLLGPQWKDAAPILRVLCGAGALLSVGYVTASVLRAVGRPLALTLIQAFMLVVYFPLMALLYPFGLIGIAAAYTLTLAVALPFRMALMRRMTDLRVVGWWQPLLGISVVCAAMSGAMVGVLALLPDTGHLLRLVAATITGAMTYALLGRLFLKEPAALLMASLRTLSRRASKKSKSVSPPIDRANEE